jgi:hypothetical protein
VRVLAGATDVSDAASGEAASTGAARATAPSSLAAVGAAGRADLRIGATLVAGAWPELGLAGLLWDGKRLVGLAPSSSERLAGVLHGLRPPVALELAGLEPLRRDGRLGIPVVALGPDAGDTSATSGPPSQPGSTLPGQGDAAAWVSIVGVLAGASERRTIGVSGSSVAVEVLCDHQQLLDDGAVTAVGVALADPVRLIVPCGGIRPAPTLALVNPAAAMRPRSAPRDATGADASSGTPVDGRRGMAAGLLAAGVALVAAATLLRRRLEPDDGGEVAQAADDADNADAERQPAAPQLTLVRVPRERGP